MSQPAPSADSYRAERVPARGGISCEEHFNVEAWIGNGSGSLPCVDHAEGRPADELEEEPSLEHFEDQPDPSEIARQQSLLRRIHIQHGRCR